MTPGLIRRVITWVLLAALVYGTYRVARSFFIPLGWGAVLAIFFYPIYRGINRRLRKPNLAAFLATAAVTLLLILPAAAILPAVTGEALKLVDLVPTTLMPRLRELIGELPGRFSGFISAEQIERLLGEAATWAQRTVASESARLAGNVAQFLFNLGVTIVAMFYFFRDGQALLRLLSQITLLGEERREEMVHEITEVVQVTVSSTFVIAAAQGLVGGLLFWAFGLPSPILWGVVMGLVSIIPVLGPWLVYIPTGLWMMLSGHFWSGVGLLVLGILIVSGVDNVLRPILIAGRAQLNYLLVFIGVVGGLEVFGMLGVVFGPVLLATGLGLLRALRKDRELIQAQIEARQQKEKAREAPAPSPSPEKAAS